MKAYEKQTIFKGMFYIFTITHQQLRGLVNLLSYGICHISCSFISADEVHCSLMTGVPSALQ